MKASATLIKGDKIGVETDYRDALPVNMYAVNREILGASGYMIQYPGLELLGTGAGKDRGANYNERFQAQYRVSGTKLVSVSTTGVVTELGTIPGTSQARLIDFYSFNTQGIIADGKFFLYDSTTGFREVTDADLGSPVDGVWVDGYYFMTDGEYIFHTDLADESAIDPLKFATAEFMPDPSIGLSKTQDNKVMVWGRYSVEYFINVATSDFAFQRLDTRAQKIGIVSTHAKCESGPNFYITGGYRDSAVGVYAVGVGESIKVSIREVDKILKQYTEPELADMRMEARTEDNVTFILVHLPNETLCFNEQIAVTMGYGLAWSIVKSDVQGTSPYRGINGVFDARTAKWVYGDKRGGNIGIINNAICTHYGSLAEWSLPTPLMNMETFSIDEIELETIPGHTGDIDAKVAFSITYDGVTYGKEYWQLYGQPNDYKQRFFLRRLGICNDWVGFKFRGASASRMAFALLGVTYS
jgi:hypothetical protein